MILVRFFFFYRYFRGSARPKENFPGTPRSRREAAYLAWAYARKASWSAWRQYVRG